MPNRCPTPNPDKRPKMLLFTCGNCGREKEIFSDELKNKHHRCNHCGRRIFAVAFEKNSAYGHLVEKALELGCAKARLIATERIEIDPAFRKMCENPHCPNFDTSAMCPPHSMLPMQFQKLLEERVYAFAFRLDFPTEATDGEDFWQVTYSLHETTAALEAHAVTLGFDSAAGFSGGSCKRTFCREFDCCTALNPDEKCRFPDKAHPSLSGVGVNFHKLYKELDWSMIKDEFGNRNPETQIVSMSGLILLD